MKIARIMIVAVTLGLAALAGTSDAQTLHTAACRADTLATLLSGVAAPGQTCQR